VWPNVFGADRDAYMHWTRHDGPAEMKIPAAFGGPSAAAARGNSNAEVGPPQLRATRGVNLVGHALSEKGIGEALRASARAMVAASLPHCVIDFPDRGSENGDHTLIGTLHDPAYPVNVVHLNADAFPFFVDQCGERILRGRYNIGFWMWELLDFPAVFARSFSYVDEVWVASSFCLEAISRCSPVPVVKIPLALPDEGLPTAGVDRKFFGLPNDAVTFLFIFDVHSIIERKNPFGVIEAFRRAFKRGEHVRLVMKLVHGTRRIRQALTDAASDARVILVDRVMDRRELNSLIESCDCYVSLHRSEGFGITIAEAMALGKPVIATAYSGNVDFMNPSNSYPVGYSLVPLEDDYGPYPRGSVWADPDLDQAAALMRHVYENSDQARALGTRAARDIWTSLAPANVGALMKTRLQAIAQRLGD
jgi:glycosyltransferase involved in cell wall biosynthesis